MVPAQWRDLHIVDVGTPSARLYRAVVLDAMQAVGRYVRAIRRRDVTRKQEEERRQLVAWLSARGVAACAYRVPFQHAMAYGFPQADAESIRLALLVALHVIPRTARVHFTFDERILRRHYVQRLYRDREVA
jgi:hypothetical protein